MYNFIVAGSKSIQIDLCNQQGANIQLSSSKKKKLSNLCKTHQHHLIQDFYSFKHKMNQFTRIEEFPNMI
jgi:translation initiation factor IF-2